MPIRPHYSMKPITEPKKNTTDSCESIQLRLRSFIQDLLIRGLSRGQALLFFTFLLLSLPTLAQENSDSGSGLVGNLKNIGAVIAGSDFHTLVSDASGISKGDPVKWRGAKVGEIIKTGSSNGKIRLDVDLDPEFENGIPNDVKAWATSGILGIGSQNPHLKLVRLKFKKTETKALTLGAQVKEAALYESLPYRQIVWIGIALLVIFVAFSIVKGIYKLAIRLVLILVLVIAGYIGWTWWQGKIDTPVGAAESVRDMGKKLAEKIKDFAADKIDREDLKTLWDNLKDSTLEKIKSKKLTPEEKEELIQTLNEKKSELDPSEHPEIMEELNSLLGSLKEA